MGKGGKLDEEKTTYTWDEISRHDKKDDRWLVIQGDVYNITDWSKRHPGGSRVIGHYAGQDATDAFRAFHNDIDHVKKYLKPLKLGGVEQNQERSIEEDFRNLRSTAEQMGLFKTSYVFFAVYLIHIIVIEVLSYLTLFYFGTGWVPLLTSILLYGIVQMGKDPDVRLDTFMVVGDVMPVEDLAVMLFFNLKFLLIFVPLLGWGWTLFYYEAFRVVDSMWFTWVTQSNHIPMNIEHDDKKPWLKLHLFATCDVEKSFFNDWFTGHLNFQIEHHLFPTMPRHNLYKIQPLVKSLCNKHGIPFEVKSLQRSFADILKSLKHSGKFGALLTTPTIYHSDTK
ncbi:FADS2 [Mytilus edulis]|uniref:FADS2 n=1 Tax=Mytilus edulis TaxID=6550 RepID=A0A8S3S5X8_MYTED|nr:FADS2 [Mytilus edulis]